MYPQDKNEVKVEVAARQETVSSDMTVYVGVLLLVVLSVIVLIGQSTGGM